MNVRRQINPTKSISVAFLLGFIAIAGLLTYVTTITNNGIFDTRTKAALVTPQVSCAGTGKTCMTAANCQSMHRFNIGKLNCVGTLVCCSLFPTPTPTQVPSLIMKPKSIAVSILAGTSVRAFYLTSTGATGFTMYGYPTTHGPGINWSPSSGGIKSGSTIPINISVNSGISAGTYIGTGSLRSIPAGTTIQFPVSVHVTAPTPTPTPVPGVATGLTMNPQSIDVTLTAGTTVKAFGLTSTGATGFTMYGYPTTYGPGINWTPSSGGITSGSTIPISIQVNSGITAGTYTGSGKLINATDNSYILFPVTVHVLAPMPTGLTMSATSIDVTVTAGTSIKAFDLTSTGATGFTMYGYPTTHGPGINWLPSSGGITNGSSIPIQIQVNSGIASGTYTGTGRLISANDNSYIDFPVTVHVL